MDLTSPASQPKKRGRPKGSKTKEYRESGTKGVAVKMRGGGAGDKKVAGTNFCRYQSPWPSLSCRYQFLSVPISMAFSLLPVPISAGTNLHGLLSLAAYYRGAMGILLVYDVTDESSFNNIRNWIRDIEQHASDNVNKVLIGNKPDMDESKRAVPTSKGQALADEYGIKFFETSAKTNLNVEEVFFSIARDIKQRLADTY